MEKLKLHSVNLTERNIDKLAIIFPSVITESRDAQGHLKRAIDFDQLKQLISEDLVEGTEAYEFTWVGKKAAILDANKPIRKTLRPIPEESQDWEHTKNLYIEGDNLDVLKLLQESYLGKVKMIYIDPPYNTGQDFVYRDDFAMSQADYDEESGAYDEDGNRLFKNNDSNGRFHSDWCSMIYARLLVARNLLREDGVIFISIDEHEHKNILNIANEVFGEENYIDSIIWNKKSSAKGVPPKNMMVSVHEYIVAYQNNYGFKFTGEKRTAENDGFKNPDSDPRGPWRESNIKSTTKPIEEAFTIVNPENGKEYTNTWAFSKETLEKMISEKRILWKESLPKQKEFMNEMTNENKAIKSNWGVFDAQSTTVYLKKLIPSVKFDNPKPIALMEYLVKVSTDSDDLILDFFSGSATTAHAVMQLNAEDGGNRRFIMVQLPEATDAKSEAYKAGFKNICEIGKERIRRAGEKIVSENPLTTGTLDTGFRVLKVDSSNMKDVYYTPSEYTQDLLASLESNIKEDRSELDLLFGCLVDWGLDLSACISREVVAGYPVYVYGDGLRPGQAAYEYGEIGLVACFADALSEDAVKAIAKFKPLRVVFRDSSFHASPDKINVTELFKLLSPDTTIRVI